MSRIGITGTDTGVGKTVISCALVAALHEMGTRVAAMKPVESGGTDDAQRLRAAAGSRFPLELVGPVSLPDPLAPLVAARRARRTIEIAALDRAFEQLSAQSDVVVVEGAGGILVPITESDSFLTLFKRWALDVVVVAPNRLGTVNHTLLTVDTIQREGMTVRAIVLNTVADADDSLADQTNQALIAELRSVPVLTFPFVSVPNDLPHLSVLGRELVAALWGHH